MNVSSIGREITQLTTVPGWQLSRALIGATVFRTWFGVAPILKSIIWELRSEVQHKLQQDRFHQ